MDKLFRKEVYMESFQNETLTEDIEAKAIEQYLEKYPYRKKLYSSSVGAQFISQIADYEQRHSDGYWQKFGYSIAGPICYAFVKWFSDLLDEKYPDVTDIAFIARDGYLLKQIYELLPHEAMRKTHYIYAPRSVCKEYAETKEYGKYSEYLQSHNMENGTIAVLDSVTMRFSAQKLLCASVDNPVVGFYWVVLQDALSEGKGLKYHSLQKKHYHMISAWNIMEFIMTSPEPPIQALENEEPVYWPTNEFEESRIGIFNDMQKGVLNFVNDLMKDKKELPSISENFIVRWINDFLSNPTQEDMDEFKNVMFSMEADHSDSIPLNPFNGKNYFVPPRFKDRIWAISRRCPLIYGVLHKGKNVYKRLLNK